MESRIQLSKALMQVESAVLEHFKAALGTEFSSDLINIESAPNSDLGDFAVGCFSLAKELKKNPAEIAQAVAGAKLQNELSDKVEAKGPYVNFFIKRQIFSQLVVSEILKAREDYGRNKIGNDEKVMVEYFSPNTNKPLTIGHLRNICLGRGLSLTLRFSGYKIVESTIYNDRGIALAKTILAYQKWGKGKTPRSSGKKPDHFVGDLYVKFSQEAKENKALEEEAKRIQRAWEDDRKEVKLIWQRLIKWVLAGYQQTLKRLKVGHFDEEYFESEIYKKGKEVVEYGLKIGAFKKHPEGYVYAELEKFGLPNKILLRSDNTALYITQDLYLASLKNQHHINKSIYVIGSEQDLQFKQLFKILELLQFKNLTENYHLSYGMIRLPDGKIKSREGLVKGTAADDLLDELENLAKKEVIARSPDLPQKEVQKRANDIALGALKFYILNVQPKKTMTFIPEQSIALTGKTGPYLQYVYARINSIFAKGKIKISSKMNASLLTTDEEYNLIKKLADFPKVISLSAVEYDLSHLANYLYDLAKLFSVFYEKNPVLSADKPKREARAALLLCVSQVLGSGMSLLDIPILKKM